MNFILVVWLQIWLIQSVKNGLGRTPQMGWNTWNHYGCNINEDIFKKNVDLLVESGLAKKGYVYANLDDCWQMSRDPESKQIIEDKTKFPSGMKALADYVHSKGLKFGLYSDAGVKTCQGRPGSYGYEKMDAKKYAEWGVDYLKYDNCYNMNVTGKMRYQAMYRALNASKRHIFYSVCNWGDEKTWQWAGPIANSWRTTEDIKDKWDSMTSIIDQQVGLEKYSGHGRWNDPDMLEIGNGGMRFHQYQVHMIFWCILKAPLLIGCDLNSINQETLELLGNEELIAINQDSLGIQASRIIKEVQTEGTTQVWGGKLSENRYVVVLFNRGEQTSTIDVSIQSDLNLPFEVYTIRDALNHKDLGESESEFLSSQIPGHSAEIYVLQQADAEQEKQIIINDEK